ncbi:required for meiotic nuclear division protein 1 homolog [Glandiceps talaboti]
MSFLTQFTRCVTTSVRRFTCRSPDGLQNQLSCTRRSTGWQLDNSLRRFGSTSTQSSSKVASVNNNLYQSSRHTTTRGRIVSGSQGVSSCNNGHSNSNHMACKECVHTCLRSQKTGVQNDLLPFTKYNGRLKYESYNTSNLINKFKTGALLPAIGQNFSVLFHNCSSTIDVHRCVQYQVRWNSTSSHGDTHTQKIMADLSIKSQREKKKDKEGSGDKKHLKSRPRTKNPSRLTKEDLEDYFLCTAFSTAEEYNLEHLNFDLQAQKLCTLSSMPQDVQDVLHMKTNNAVGGELDREPGEIFFFREGSVVFWNVKNTTMKKVMRIISKHEIGSYEVALVNWENEQMLYKYTDQSTKLVKDEIMLNSANNPQATTLEKFTFSNAMALSVKLAIWEYSLDRFVGSIEWVPENLKAGRRLNMSMQEVMKRVGELFELRHHINLSSDLLMTPDFYWDRESLELIYSRMCNYLNIARRTKVMNEKLNHCSEMVELMRTHLNDRHSLRLEWMIILLIAIEVVFEIVHYVERFIEKQYPPEMVPSHPPSS